MKRASLAELSANLASYLGEPDDEPVLVTDGERLVGVFVGLHDEEDIERYALSLSTKFQRILEEARESIRRTGGMSHEEFWRVVDELYGGDEDQPAEHPPERSSRKRRPA
jgi:hypothetical protein